MGNNVKVLIGEINGQELDQQEEYTLQLDDLPTVDVSTAAPNIGDHLEWDGTNWVPGDAGDTTNKSKLNQCQFFGQGSVGNKWLALGASSKTSDMVPYSIVHDVNLVAISWVNDDSTIDVDIEVYKNGTAPGDKVATFTSLNKKTFSKTDITTVAFSHGDRVSIFLKKNTLNATDPIVTLYFQVTTVTSSEVST